MAVRIAFWVTRESENFLIRCLDSFDLSTLELPSRIYDLAKSNFTTCATSLRNNRINFKEILQILVLFSNVFCLINLITSNSGGSKGGRGYKAPIEIQKKVNSLKKG